MIASLLAGMLSLSLVSAWIKRRSIEIMEGDEYPRRWIAWGKCIPMTRNPRHVYGYFLLRLPGWYWENSAWKRPDHFEWHRHYLQKFGPLNWTVVSLPDE